jgi:hypothetical protein
MKRIKIFNFTISLSFDKMTLLEARTGELSGAAKLHRATVLAPACHPGREGLQATQYF